VPAGQVVHTACAVLVWMAALPPHRAHYNSTVACSSAMCIDWCMGYYILLLLLAH
jgi:hypothetical protein